ncbi:DNA processing protein DprA [Cellulomonas denverensis]|nr:DNA processing protein DprA [Cellulomonas denverensis]
MDLGSRVVSRAAADAELLARVGWSCCTEPGDRAAVAVIDALGAAPAWEWLLSARTLSPTRAARVLVERLRVLDDTDPDAPLSAPSGRAVPVLARALERWRPRLDTDPERMLAAAGRIGAQPLIPGRTGWPERVADLGGTAPICLWVRGEPRVDQLVARSVALVGARAASDYGEQVTTDLAVDLARGGVTVLSGGAYGIDAAAHRGALAGRPAASTVALLAGGPDRLTPAGNAELLRRVIDQGGSVIAESPPGRPPSRSRFLLRNRLIAALTGATVVVEAGWRSGALNTAHHAAELFRPVGAVPGPVTSAASAGCHRLLRSGVGVCVTDAAEVRELLVGAAVRSDGGRGPDAGDDGSGCGLVAMGPGHGSRARGGDMSGGARRSPPGDAPPHSRRARVMDALRRYPAGTARVAARAGLAIDEVEAELGLLELDGVARRTSEGRWATVPEPER